MEPRPIKHSTKNTPAIGLNRWCVCICIYVYIYLTICTQTNGMNRASPPSFALYFCAAHLASASLTAVMMVLLVPVAPLMASKP